MLVIFENNNTQVLTGVMVYFGMNQFRVCKGVVYFKINLSPFAVVILLK